MTNADVIRTMSNEELIKFFVEYKNGYIDTYKPFCSMCPPEVCDQCFGWWLFHIDAEEHPQGLLHYKKVSRAICSTCGRCSDNYREGTHCPIEEHYALPKDGHCHLWEPREGELDGENNRQIAKSSH